MTTSRRGMKKRGVPPQTAKRDHYLALMKQGIGNSAACRAVGINRRTGSRWRYGRTITNRVGQPLIYPPILQPARPSVSARFLSEDERIAVGDGLIAGHSIRVIAAELGRSPSTISREVHRNGDPHTGAYQPFRAQTRAAGRRGDPGPESWLATASSGLSSRPSWINAGAPNRSPRCSRGCSPTGTTCAYATSRSTRRSTYRAGASYNAIPCRCCVQDAPAVGHVAGGARRRGSWLRWCRCGNGQQRRAIASWRATGRAT